MPSDSIPASALAEPDYSSADLAPVEMPDLYWKHGRYWYADGFNWRAIIALAAGVAPCLPGFLDAIGLIETLEPLKELYHYAWFVSFAIAFVVYLALMTGQRTEELHAHRL